MIKTIITPKYLANWLARLDIRILTATITYTFVQHLEYVPELADRWLYPGE